MDLIDIFIIITNFQCNSFFILFPFSQNSPIYFFIFRRYIKIFQISDIFFLSKMEFTKLKHCQDLHSLIQLPSSNQHVAKKMIKLQTSLTKFLNITHASNKFFPLNFKIGQISQIKDSLIGPPCIFPYSETVSNSIAN